MQVVRVAGVRLEVWGDQVTALGALKELEATIPPEGDGAPSAPGETTNEGGGS